MPIPGIDRSDAPCVGHLFEGAMAGTAAQIDAWFATADTSRRLAQLASD